MGWLYNTHPQSKEAFIKEILQDFNKTLLLAHSVRDNRLWVLAQNPGQEPFIILFLLERHDGCWGYKDMDESMGPYYYDCPLSYLDRAPEPMGFCRDHAGSGKSWRDHVREHHAQVAARRHSRPRVGDEIVLADERFPGRGGTYRVTADLGRRGIELNGYIRMKSHQIKWVEAKAPASLEPVAS